MLDEMESRVLKGIEDGWLESLMDDENYRREQEIQNGERLVIGVDHSSGGRQRPTASVHGQPGWG